MKPAILVTGGAGYIGSHTCKVLARSGCVPIAYDNLVYGHPWAVKWGPLVKGDVANGQLVRDVLRSYGVKAVVHFAAYAYVGESVENPRKYFQNNVSGTLSLLDAMLDEGVKHIVFSSTCATYGIPERIPIGEDEPSRPVNPYGESKRFVESALHWYGRAYGLTWAALRYFNAAGADPEGEIGEEHAPETHLIPLVIKAALGDLPYVEIYGTDYPTPDGTAIRDYIHVTDLAEAHVRALHHLWSGGEGVTVNLGTGQGHSVREVIKGVEQVSGRRVPAREAPRRPGDPPALVADATRAGGILGWRPERSELSIILETAWRWHEGRQRKSPSETVL
jgi:UDP-arabinose 4-epimerase